MASYGSTGVRRWGWWPKRSQVTGSRWP